MLVLWRLSNHFKWFLLVLDLEGHRSAVMVVDVAELQAYGHGALRWPGTVVVVFNIRFLLRRKAVTAMCELRKAELLKFDKVATGEHIDR
jgi:hypothetical protein